MRSNHLIARRTTGGLTNLDLLNSYNLQQAKFIM